MSFFCNTLACCLFLTVYRKMPSLQVPLLPSLSLSNFIPVGWGPSSNIYRVILLKEKNPSITTSLLRSLSSIIKKKEREANPAPLFLLSNLIFFDTHRMGFLFVSILLLLKKKNKPSGRALFAISSR